MLNNIASSLGIGSGIDTAALVRDLANAVRAPKEAALDAAESRNRAQVSALGSASSALKTFADALTQLFDGPGFYGTLKSSDDNRIGVSALDNARPPAQPASLTVTALAAAQVSKSAALASSTTAIGDGALTLTGPNGAVAISLDSGGTSLSAIAAKINGAGAGVTASIAQDIAGYRLILAGTSGAANAFTLTADAGSSTGLADFAAGLTPVQSAANAAITVDGVALEYASNIITTAVPGVKLTLRGVTFTLVSISAEPPEATIKQLMGEYVSAYNQLRTALNGAVAPGGAGSGGGPLAGDAGIRTMMRSLGALSLTPLAAIGSPSTLSDLGIQTARDGTLTFNSARFDTAFAADPERVRALLDPATGSDATPGIAGALTAIRDRLEGTGGPLAASRARYDAVAKRLAESREKLDDADDRYRASLERSFAAMEKQMVVLRATQSYVTQQIAAWNNSNSN